jgi:acetyl-CoA acetyltransferase
VNDCDLPVWGVGAFVLTTAERARDLPHKPVHVAGFGQGALRKPGEVWALDQVLDGGAATAANLWDSSGLRREDLDVPQLYDGFAPITLFWLESLGYCGRGEAASFVNDPALFGPGAALPFLSSGGALGNGRMHGVPQMLELYLQLAGRAGARQLASATAGIACHAYPHFGGVGAYTAEPV